MIYPFMVKFLLSEHGFKRAVMAYAAVIGGSSLFAFVVLLKKNPNHIYRKPEHWGDLKVWIDVHAFQDPAFCWLTAGVCWMFFGFYSVFFNLEDVCRE